MSTIKEYLSELSGRRVTVIGMGVSNIPLIKMLLRAGVEVTVRDRSPRERLAEQAQELEKLLNTLGAEGWELVQKADGFYFFKREKSAPSE